MKLRFLTSLLCFLVSLAHVSGQVTQTIRGTVVDKTSEFPLVGAAIKITNLQPVLGAVADASGAFELKNVPLGRHQIAVSFLGYKSISIPNIVVNAGKETFVELALEEEINTLETVVIDGKVEKSQTLNELATISARQFNVEEVQRYSGGGNDVSRLVANFAGVATGNDSRNDIVVRGNSPIGVLWRLEGVPMPNPNHFATLGTTGGTVSALNPNLIRNSDFLTAAFPSEYGNANASVFDIGFRTGNKEKYEFTAQLAAFSGLEAMVEGPFRKSAGGSFLVAYRYSFIGLATAAGIDIGTNALPIYQDLSFNFDFGQTKWGRFSLFGIAGTSKIDFLANQNDTLDFFTSGAADEYARSEFGVTGLKHNLLLNNTTYIRTVISASRAGNTFNTFQYKNGVRRHTLDLNDFLNTLRVSSFLNKKFSAKTSMRTGFLVQANQLDVKTLFRRDTSDAWIPDRENDGTANISEAYSQWQHKLNDALTFNAGVHAQYFDLNQELVVEPRLGVNIQFAPRHSLSFGYGMHHQTPPLPIVLDKIKVGNEYVETNKNLKSTRSQHFVLGYDWRPNADWRVKAETYYQFLDKVPVQPTPSTYSLLNLGGDFGFDARPNLVNKGMGENYGLELTVEKYFSNDWYLLTTTSIFDAKYRGSDGIERNTAFNGNHVFNILGGKEWKFGKNRQHAFVVSTKFTNAGGRYVTPINLAASRAQRREVLDGRNAFSEKLPNYYRWDIKIGYTLNNSKRKLTQQFFLDFRNVTNHGNIFTRRYSVSKGDLYNVYQLGFFPDVLWRFQF